jgi:predicted N-formylglutamate amidohydrolase
MLSRFRFIITCEHASPAIPERWARLLDPYCAQCETHQLWDPGAPEIAAWLGKLLNAPVFKGEYTRLLVDLNRSVHHASLFSPPMRELSDRERTRLLTSHYYPFRHQVIKALDYLVTERRPIIHLSVHSFTPILRGEVRTADFGLLYDPSRELEKELGATWLHHIRATEPDFASKANYPYLGSSDGHTTAMRRAFGRHRYLGFELEFNQKLPLAENAATYARWMIRSLKRALNSKRVMDVLEPGSNIRFLPAAI